MNYNYEELNSRQQTYIPTGDLRVAPFEIEQLHSVEIRQGINEHGTLYLTGLLKDTQTDDDLRATEGGNIALFALGASEEAYVLFQGIVESVAIVNIHGTRYIEVRAISYSYILDIEKRRRSFQDKNKTYTDLIKQVAGAYGGAAVADVVSNGAPTNKFIMQHEETDWAFLKRLASHFNTGLLCDVRFDKPACYFGVPESGAFKIDDSNYTYKMDLQRFYELSDNGVNGISSDDFIRYEVDTNCVVMIGDSIKFDNTQFYVSEIVATADKELFVSRLALMPKKGLSQPYQPNNGVIGASYSGTILDIRNDQVKIGLGIDAGHDPGTPCWFPYSTIYSSRGGSGWYCMPEKGDSIRIYFPDGEDDHAYAISSVHEQVDDDAGQRGGGGGGGGGGGQSGGAGGYSGNRDNPDVKSLTYGDKEIRLTPEGVYIITEGSMITMTEDGIMVSTENDIEFCSDMSIVLNAEEDVNVVGTSGVELDTETAALIIEEDIKAIGQEVHAN